jgi:eukaryotic-like serine/threonine-protein kinase
MAPDLPHHPDPPNRRYRFGLFEVDPADGSLLRQGKQVKLQEQPFQLLVALLARHGEVVSREEIRQRLWPSDTFVDFDKSLGVAVTKLRDALGDAASNPRFIETLPRRGYRFVAPVELFTSAQPGDSPTATLPIIPKTEMAASSAPNPNRGRYLAALLILVSCLVPIALIVLSHFHLTRAFSASTPPVIPGVAPPHVRRSVAVLGFRNLPARPQDDWLSAAFSEMLNTELAAGGTLRLVAGEDIARAKRDVPISNEDTLAKSTLARLRTDPGADLVILGSYATIPKDGKNRIRLDIRLQDTSTGETVAEDSLTGTEDGLFELASQAGSHLRQSLGLNSISADDSSAARAALPVNANAVRLYSEGRAKLFNYDFLSARDLLTKAVAADPNYPLAHSALSEALWHLGYEVKSRASAQRALELSTHLPEEDRLLVEGQYQRAVAAWPKAVEAYQTLFNRFPDRLDYGLLLASAQVQSGGHDALPTLSQLRKLPPPASDDPRIDTVEASALMSSDLPKSHAAAERAIAKSTAQGSPVLVAFTYGLLCEMGSATANSTEQAIKDCERARQTSVAVHDQNGEAMAVNNLAALHYQMGDIAGSERMFVETIKHFRAIGNPDGVAAAEANLGAARLARGDLDGARKYFQDSIPNYRAVEDRVGVALSLNNLGDSYRQSGDLDAAKSNYDEALVVANQTEDKNSIAYILSGLGDVLFDRGDLPGARKSYEQALTLRQQIGEKESTAQSQVALALISIEEGQAAAAEAVLRQCQQQFEQQHQSDDVLDAGVALTSALLAQNKLAEAQQEIERIKPFATSSQNRHSRLQFALASARAMLASDNFQAADVPLQQLLRDAQQARYLGLELEARLALAELAKNSGQRATAQTQFASLESAARVKGFALIARKAAAQS